MVVLLMIGEETVTGQQTVICRGHNRKIESKDKQKEICPIISAIKEIKARNDPNKI